MKFFWNLFWKKFHIFTYFLIQIFFSNDIWQLFSRYFDIFLRNYFSKFTLVFYVFCQFINFITAWPKESHEHDAIVIRYQWENSQFEKVQGRGTTFHFRCKVFWFCFVTSLYGIADAKWILHGATALSLGMIVMLVMWKGPANNWSLNLNPHKRKNFRDYTARVRSNL